jgi:chromate reductase, NAD(P)H dehydrogenase (quinone)
MTEKYEVAVIVGSLRADSYSSRLAQALISVAPASLTFQSVGISTLPLYNQDLDENTPAGAVRRPPLGKVARTAPHFVVEGRDVVA